MYFLLSGCQNPDILRLILLAKKILNIAFIIIPIGLIIFIIIDLIKIMLNGEDKGGKNVKLIISRVIFAILVFFAPTIVSVVMNTLANAGVDIGSDYKMCIDNAEKDIIEDFQQLQDEEDRIAEEKRKQELQQQQQQNSGNSNSGNNTKPGTNTNSNSQTDNGYIGIEGTGNLYQDLADRMIQIARAEVGYKETYSNATTYTSKYGEAFGSANSPWCSAFVFWVAKNTEVNGTNLFNGIIQKEGKVNNPLSAVNSIYTFNNNKNLNFYFSKTYGGNYTPKKGDLIYFYYNKTWDKKITPTMHLGNGSHVEIVESVNGNNITTIGGNNKTGETIKFGEKTVEVYGVTRTTNYYTLDSKSILGYGSWYQK